MRELRQAIHSIEERTKHSGLDDVCILENKTFESTWWSVVRRSDLQRLDRRVIAGFYRSPQDAQVYCDSRRDIGRMLKALKCATEALSGNEQALAEVLKALKDVG